MNNVIKTRGAKDKKSLCKSYRSTKLELTSSGLEEWARSRVEREAVKVYRTTPISLSDLDSFINAEMDKIPSVSDVTKRNQTLQVKMKVFNYLQFDNRKMFKCYPREFRFSGETLRANPDFYHESEVEVKKNGRTVKVPFIEVFTVSTSVPKFQTSRKGPTSLYEHLTACGDLLYGKSLLRGREGIVKISYDYLKTKHDRAGQYAPFSEAKPDKFTISGSDNRCSIEVYFGKSGKIARCNSHYTSANKTVGVFENYKVSLMSYLNGCEADEMKKGTCEKCEFFDRCKGYNKRPAPRPEQKTSGKTISRDDIELTEEQRRVVAFRHGVCCVDAGPGSGKTFSVALRIADMIVEGAKPEDFLLLSFSKAAVEVLKKRIDYLVNEVYQMGIDVSKIKVATYNSLGNEIIMKYYPLFGFTSAPNLIDDVESIDLIREAMDWSDPIQGLDYTNPLMKLGQGGVIPRLYKIFKDIRQLSTTDLTNICGDLSEKNQKKVLDTYTRFRLLMVQRNFIDYSDQSNLVEHLIKTNPQIVMDMYNYKHIISDEFQDSNDMQMLLINTLTCADDFISLLVVGDPDQAIWGFRGVGPENIINFDDKMGISGVDDLSLTVNHRSAPEVVTFANELIDVNSGTHKKMSSSRKSNGKIPKFKGFEVDSKEFAWVADEIEALVKSGVNPYDIAFISHTRSKLARMQELLAERGVLALLDQPEYILEDSKVKAIISLSASLKDGTNKGIFDYLSEVFDNTLMGNKNAEGLIEFETDKLISLFEGLSLEEKKTAFMNLVRGLDDGTDNLYKAFIERLESKSSYDYNRLLDYIYKFDKYQSDAAAEKSGEYDSVRLVTAHSCKGKEWKHVFVSLSDFDSARLRRNELDEKVRLIYVACTRAEDELVVTSAKYRETKEGDSKPLNRWWKLFKNLGKEPFLEDITPILLEQAV